MALVTHKFKLDLTPGASRQVLYTSQGDIGRPFEADLYWNGSPWTATGTTANIRGKKPDDTVFDYTATVSGTAVTFETTEQMTIISGPVECELVFSNDGDVIASANFVLIVEESPYNPDALSESDVEGLTDLLTGFQRLNRDSNGVVKIGDDVTAGGTADAITGFYVHDETNDTDGVAKYSAGSLVNLDETVSAAGYAPDAKAVRDIFDTITEQTYNLVVGKKSGYSIGSNGKINANSTTDMFSAPVEQGKTYYVTTNESSLIYGYFTSDPFEVGAVSYNGSRTIQNPKYITAPITGYIAFRTLTGFENAQISDGNSEKPYIPPITAVDYIARKQSNDAISINYDAFIIHSNKYANTRNCTLSDLATAQAVEFPVFDGIVIKYGFTLANPDARGLYFTDVYGNGFNPIPADTSEQEVVVPSGAVKCFATISDISQVKLEYVVNALLENSSNVYTVGLKAQSVPLEVLSDETGMLDLFLHVGCIGDSLASGESYWNDGGTVQGQDFYQYSWGQFLARKTGNTYYNWSKGGLMAKTWLESEYAAECFDGNHKCEAYIIGLGQNDRNHSVTIGTAADIDLTDYNNNADTFYGNYGKIIQKIKEVQPQAKIFVITDPNPYVNRDGYNAPIADMPNIFENVYLLDFYTYASKYYNNPIIQAQMRGSHYNAYGYKLFSMMIANYINWIITTNYTDFTQVELIGTGHSWTN